MMTLTIELTPDQEARLQAEASALGMDLSEFAKLRLLDDAAFRKVGTAEEEEADECAWAARFEASGDLLERMAADADEEHALGRTIPLETLLSEG